MPADVTERAFEPFFTTKAVGKGTGLGLSQIHGFAAQAGGRAEIRSVEGEGTTVSIILPRTDRALDVTAVNTTMSDLPTGLNVLLVEDNAQVREFAEGLLADLGCTVRSVDSAQTAMDLLVSERFDFVLSDVVMPGITGVELARRIREDHPDVPVLLATGYSDEILRTGTEFAVLAKPFGAADLSKAMAEVLSARKAERAA
jgi:CheY-like chemotaxis protein